MAEIKKINTELQPIDKLLDTSGDAGTSGQILSSTGSGTNWIANTGGGGTVTGTGAATRVAFWSDTTELSSNADLYWDNTNDRLGIGTASPSKKLHVKDTGYQLQLAGDNNYWNIGAGWTNYYDGSFLIANSTGDKFFINSLGNTGIGTTTPDSKLSVTSTSTSSADILYLKSGIDNADEYLGIAFEVGGGGNGPHGAIRVYNGPSSSDTYMSLLTTTDGGTLTQGLTQNHLGNIGIGVVAPSSRFEVLSSSDYKYVRFRADNNEERFKFYVGASGNSSALTMYDASEAAKVKIATGGDSYFNGGNFGIGTASPTKELDVRDEARIWNGANGIELSYSTTNTSGIVASANTSGNLEFRTDVGAAAKMFITNAGLVGIGTATPSELLELKPASGADAKINILKSDGTQKALVGYDNGNGGLLKLYNEAGTTNVFVRGYGDSYFNGGNFGIGTASPAKKLHIVGADGASGSTSGNSDTALLIDNDGANGAIIELMASNDSKGSIFFTDEDASNRGGITYGHTNDEFIFKTAATTALTIDSSQDATFARDITARIGNFKSPDATASTLMNLMANDGSNAATFRTTSSGKIFEIRSQNSGTLKFDSTSAEFTGSIYIPEYIRHTSDPSDDTYFGFSGNDTFVVYTAAGMGIEIDSNRAVTLTGVLNIAAGQKIYLGGSTARMQVYHTGSSGEAIVLNKEGNLSLINQSHGDDIVFKTENSSGTVVTPLTLDSAGAATFVGQVTIPVTPTANAHAASKKYVDDSLVNSTIYQGTWDANDGAGGNPDLTTSTYKTNGYYFVVSVAGDATPNDPGTTPDDWHVGDWVIYNTHTGSGAWQKIDNSSVISGAGTGQKVVKWDGSGTSETLADGPITFSTNDSTFAGHIIPTTDNTQDLGTTNSLDFRTLYIRNIDIYNQRFRMGSTGTTAVLEDHSSVGDGFQFLHLGTEILRLGNDTATSAVFAGDVAIPQTKKLLLDGGSGHTYISEVSDSNLKIYVAATQVVNISNDHWIFDKPIGVGSGAAPNQFHDDADDIIVGAGSGNTGLTIYSGTTGYGSIFFADGTADDATEKRGQIRYLQGSEVMTFHTDNVGTAALSLNLDQSATFAGDVGMVTGHSSGKFAVMSAAVHGSYDFYNNGTTYLNGATTVDALLTVNNAVNIESASGGRYMTLDAPTLGAYITFETGGTAYADIGSASGIVGSGTDTDTLMIKGRSGKEIALGAGGAEAMRITSDGKVGIGTSSPTGKLEIQNAQVTTQFDRDCFLRLHPSATTDSGGFTNIFFGTSTVNNYGVAIGGKREGTDGEPSFSIRMLDDSIVGTEVLNISATGNATFGGNVTLSGTKDLIIGGTIYGNNLQAISSAGLKVGNDNYSGYVFVKDSGEVCIGTESPSSNGNYGTGDLNVENDTFASAQIISHSNSVGNFSFLGIGKSSGTGASPTIVQADETVGLIGFYGYDGGAYRRTADIRSIVDGTPGSSDMPGNLEFWTTADGASSSTRRLTIGQDGNATFAGNITFSSASDIIFPDNLGAALEFKEGSNLYMRFVTTNSSEEIQMEKATTISNTLNVSSTATFAGNVLIGPYTGQYTIATGLNIAETSPTIQLFDTTNDCILKMYSQDSSSVIGTYSNHPLLFYTNSQERLKLTQAGDIQFYGDLAIESATPYITLYDTDNSTSIIFSSIGGALQVDSASDQIYQIGSTEYFRIATTGATFAGNVGVTNILHIEGAATGSPYIDWRQDGSQKAYIQYADSGDDFNMSSDGQMTFKTNGESTALTLNSSQNAIFEGRIIANGTDVTFNPDGDSTAVIKNAGTNAIALFAGSGDTLYLGGNDTTGMYLDASANATFAGAVSLTGGALSISGDGSNATTLTESGSGDFTIDSVGNITLDAEGANDIIFKYKGSDTAMAIDGGVMRIITSAPLQVDNGIVLNGDSNIQLDTAVSSGESSGTIIKAGTTMSMTAGQVVYGSNSMGSLIWSGADADTGTKNILGLALGTSPTSDGILLNGIYHEASHNFTIGLPLYISTTGGEMTTTAPSGSGDYVRVVGYAIDSNHIYFCPDNTWVKID